LWDPSSNDVLFRAVARIEKQHPFAKVMDEAEYPVKLDEAVNPVKLD